jgi:vitellogenic carboxypeptidase-like protein
MAPSLNYYSSYVVSDAVRQAIGVGLLPYVDGNPLVEQALRGDVMFTQKPRLEALLQSGLNVLIYNGALDLICGAPLTERYLRVLRWSGSRDFLAARRQLWHDPVYPGGAISGFWRKARNLQQIVMRGAGHLAPFDQPARSLDLITRFVDGKDFD